MKEKKEKEKEEKEKYVPYLGSLSLRDVAGVAPAQDRAPPPPDNSPADNTINNQPS